MDHRTTLVTRSYLSVLMLELVRFELRYHFRQPSLPAAASFFFAMGFAIMATGFGPENLPLNSHYLITETYGFLSLFSLFATAIFSSQALLRDSEYRLEEIIFSMPVQKSHFIVSRFTGNFLATITTVLFFIPGMILATYMPWQNPERVAPFNLTSYIWPILTIVLPNVLTATTLLSVVTVWTRNAVAIYAASVVIYILYFVGAAFTNSPLMAASVPGAGGGLFPALIDPFGLSAFFEETRYWTVTEKISRFVPLRGLFLLNRLIWLGFVAMLMVAIQKKFSFRLARSSSGKRAVESIPASLSYIPISPTKNRTKAWIASYFSAVKLEFRSMVRGVPLLLLLWMILAATELYSGLFHGEYDTAFYPTTGLIITILHQPIIIVSTILLIYYGAEILWRERQYGMSSFLHATPVSSSSMMLAKWTALAILVFSVIASGILEGVLLQALNGYWDLQPSVYFSLFYFAGFPFLLFGAAVALIHTISPTKYVGMIGALALIVFSLKGQSFGFEQHLWRFAAAPGVQYSDMNGFGDVSSFHWYMLYWSALAGIFILVASQLWRSGWSKAGLKRCLGARFAILAAIFVASGAWIFYNTNVRNDHTTTSELYDWKADYEKKYKPQAELVQPKIIAVDLQIDLYPEDGRYDIDGTYKLQNASDVPIGSVLVAVRRDATIRHLSMSDAALETRDQRFGVYTYRSNRAIQPGDELELRFQLRYARTAFQDGDQNLSLVRNGSAIFNFLSVPTLGYRKTYELNDPHERKKRGLAGTGTEELEESGYVSDNPEWIQFAAQISTAQDQIALAPGRLVKSWKTAGRRHFIYRSDRPTQSIRDCFREISCA